MKKGEKVVEHVQTIEQYKEWMSLILEAKQLGLTANEIRGFFENCEKRSRKH
ncbi:DNA-binding anti-repressor SinI [Peribacillus cavernae]|uniref:DNA-binding anti-repressor SinI n=1 Tax=Peribacillus cavernae TaxID=1674310 RepID=A0A433HP37_9BACI|nr:anti-repressor SinI family protein [Peribacillus cavernae]MDQ0217449.1 hypothetical protein [Peribacillus cavernae]RUQ30107.1 DNA-binding anti-repressor SinI [Peribacillus cavernae]